MDSTIENDGFSENKQFLLNSKNINLWEAYTPPEYVKLGKIDQWNLIFHSLSKLQDKTYWIEQIESLGPSEALGCAMSSYAPYCFNLSNFKVADSSSLRPLLVDTVPFIAAEALNLPNLLENPIPKLKCGKSQAIHLTRAVASSLLANAFFCTFPKQVENFPDFNFFPIFNNDGNFRGKVKKEKIKCILNYFQQIEKMQGTTLMYEEIVYERVYNPDRVNWESSKGRLCPVQVTSKGKIEDAVGMLQVDFANKRVGGGVLNNGAVMEEILFCMAPELIVSRLFTETLEDEEVLVVQGANVFSRYEGYSTNFRFKGAFDNWNRTSKIVAMDALYFRRGEEYKQYHLNCIHRELHKCHVAFCKNGEHVPIATGNWGCGAFNGDPELKFLIQWMAASYNLRPFLKYYTVGNERQCEEFKEIVKLLEMSCSVGQLYKVLADYSKKHGGNENNSRISVFAFVKNSMQHKIKRKRLFKFAFLALAAISVVGWPFLACYYCSCWKELWEFYFNKD